MPVFRLTASFVACLSLATPALADGWHKNSLPSRLALAAAGNAVAACAASGYDVSASVVDSSGELRAFLKSDGAPVHTRDASYRKAYTVVTFGTMFGFGKSSDFVAKLRTNPNASALSSIPNVLALPGAVAVKVDGDLVAAIGVSGAPDGMQDEACARAGLASVQTEIDRHEPR